MTMKTLTTIAFLALFSARCFAQSPIPLCPIEGPGIRKPPIGVEAFINCQPKDPTAEMEEAYCAVRLPDAISGGAYVTICVCHEHESEPYPGAPPGNYVAIGSTCPAGVAAVLTAIINGPRNVASDAGCDDAGNLCSSTTGAFLESSVFDKPQPVVRKAFCRVRGNRPTRCKSR